MLSEITVAHLSTLTYRADAVMKVCWLPLSGIYWEDELPDMGDLRSMPEEDVHQILRLFGTRVRIWRGEALSDESQMFWDEMRAQVRAWAFFQRLTLSADHQRAQTEAEQASTVVHEALLADVDEVTIRERDGVQSVSATFDLTKDQGAPRKARPWWQRIFRRNGADVSLS